MTAKPKTLCNDQAKVVFVSGGHVDALRSENNDRRFAVVNPQAKALDEPLFWFRPVGSDGLYEGPVHSNYGLGKMLRDEKPGEWLPLYANPTAPALSIPEGWKLAPKKPDDNMLFAGKIVSALESNSPSGIYIAMLAAAPDAPNEQASTVLQQALSDAVEILRCDADTATEDGETDIAEVRTDMADRLAALLATTAPAQPRVSTELLKAIQQAAGADKRATINPETGAPVFFSMEGDQEAFFDSSNDCPACGGSGCKTYAVMPAQPMHPDDIAVDNFAKVMKFKLEKSRAKGRTGWNDPAQCSVEHLAKLLIEHVRKGDPTDVANLAMMLQQRGAHLHVLALAMQEEYPAPAQPLSDERILEIWYKYFPKYQATLTVRDFARALLQEGGK